MATHANAKIATRCELAKQPHSRPSAGPSDMYLSGPRLPGLDRKRTIPLLVSRDPDVRSIWVMVALLKLTRST